MTNLLRSASATARAAFGVLLIGVGLGSAQEPKPLPEANPAIEDAVRAVLSTAIDRRHIPDIHLAAATEPIPFVAEARTFRWSARVLPTDGGRPFRLTNRATLQAAADAQGGNRYYVFVSDEQLTRDAATLWVGVAFAMPSDRRGAVECCCSSQVQLRRQGQRWVLVESEYAVSRCY